jgi:hypothetical protein
VTRPAKNHDARGLATGSTMSALTANGDQWRTGNTPDACWAWRTSPFVQLTYTVVNSMQQRIEK